MPAVARTYVEAYPVAPDFGRRLGRQIGPQVDKVGEESSKRFGRKFAAGLAAGAAIIGVGLYKATKLATRGILATTSAASALNEQVNKSNAIFGSSAKEIQRWAAGARNSMGQSRTQALSAAAAFGDIFLQLKIGQRPATNMSKRLVELASDLASFSDADITQVLQAQQAAFRGEYDSLQRFIPGIKAARVEQVALNMTHKASAKDLTDAEKALATYQIMVKDTRRAHGDYAKTLQTSVANQQRKAKAQWEDLKTTLGQGFLPAQLAVTRAFTEKLLPAGLIFAREMVPGIKATATGLAQGLANSVPPARELADTARNLGARLEEFGPQLGQKIGAGLGSLFDLLKRIGPELRNANVETSDLAPTLRLSGALFGFVADHADTLARHIPLLVAGFAAYKASQAAANTAALLSLPIRAAEVAANLALSASNRALVASLGGRTAATVTVTAAESRAIPVTAAWGAASATAATRTTMLASALGVVGGAVLAGDVLDRLTDRLGKYKRAAEVAMLGTGLLSVTVGGMKDAWRAMTGAQEGATAATARGLTAAERHTRALGAERQAVTALESALRREETADLDVRQAKITLAQAQARLTGLIRSGRKGSLDYRQAQIDLRRAQLDLKARTEEYRGSQQRAAAATRGSMQAAQRAQGPYKTFGSTASTAGEKAFQMGRRARAGLGLITSRRVRVTANFAIDTGNTGLSVHQIVGATGGRVTPRAVQPMRRDRGGPVWGAGTTTSDSIPARLSDEEHVWEAAAVRGLGRGSYRRGHRRLAEMRRQARSYATGGPVLEHDFASGREMNRAGSRFQGVLAAAVTRMAARFKANMDKLFGGGLGGAGGPGGWRWQMAVLRRRFPGLPLISGFRPGAITATGNRSYHSMGRAVDIPPRMDVFNWIRGVYGRRTRELIFSPAGQRQVHNGRPHYYTGVTRSDHFDHVHWAYRRGGPVRVPHRVMDRGGVLPARSTTMVTNSTYRPEPVGIDYDDFAEAVVAALVEHPPKVYLDRVKISHELRTGNIWDRRRN